MPKSLFFRQEEDGSKGGEEEKKEGGIKGDQRREGGRDGKGMPSKPLRWLLVRPWPGSSRSLRGLNPTGGEDLPGTAGGRSQ